MATQQELIVRLEAAYDEFDKTMKELEFSADELIKEEAQKIDRAKIEEVLGKIKNLSSKQ